MSRGLEYLTDEEELDDIQLFEKIPHKVKLTARGEEQQKRKRDGQARKHTRQSDKYEP